MLCQNCQRRSACIVYRIASLDKSLHKGLEKLTRCEMLRAGTQQNS
ncbi:hypothetical protein PCC7424_0147 [Gloeothece citriformis PCC 7424]|uniref:Uncharacterized protein n=1 Tax=Gloeothece citriformis (strain PCC 7424) TaxID=65393 RepID=B7K9D4_GLOC7|nr:hypothetical protein [Gloeothece citriformis]ACK68617.1 hypothetical protein PCC7424_0147 [Gloeothece citriformis PCC 7424]